MHLNDQNKNDIAKHAIEEFPNECCGLLVDSKIVRCMNIANNKKYFFEISPQEYLKASNEGKITAFYHSHTEGNEEFSTFDKLVSNAHQLPIIMFSTASNNFKIYG